MKSILILLMGIAMGSGSLKFTDTVDKVKERDGKIRISFQRHAAFYHIDKGQKGFEELKKKLEESSKKNQPIEVTVDPTELNILEVQ